MGVDKAELPSWLLSSTGGVEHTSLVEADEEEMDGSATLMKFFWLTTIVVSILEPLCEPSRDIAEEANGTKITILLIIIILIIDVCMYIYIN